MFPEKLNFRVSWNGFLLLSTLLGLSLLVVRMSYTKHFTFIFLVWNLFLAWVPYLLSTLIKKMDKGTWRSFVYCLPILGFWLLFLPNSPYILTDLFHLRPRGDVPQWFDLILICNFAWTALWMGFLSLYNVQLFIRQRMSMWGTNFVVMMILFLTGFGVYLGRFQRFNSWDLLTQPFEILSQISQMVIHPFQHYMSTAFTLCFGLFLIVTYAKWVYLIRGTRY